MLLGDGDGAEPDLGLRVANLVELGAAGEMQEVGPGLGGPALAVGLWDGPVENVSQGFEPRLGPVVSRFEGADPRLILDGHGRVPVPKALQRRSLGTRL